MQPLGQRWVMDCWQHVNLDMLTCLQLRTNGGCGGYDLADCNRVTFLHKLYNFSYFFMSLVYKNIVGYFKEF